MSVEVRFNEATKGALKALSVMLKEGMFGEKSLSMIRQLRDQFMPTDTKAWVQSVASLGQLPLERDSYSSQTYELGLDPTPYEVPKRATSGFLAYHHTPYDTFFKTTPTPRVGVDLSDDDRKYWIGRDARSHSLLQQYHNIMQEAVFIAHRLIFNIGVKTIDYDPNLIIRKEVHPVENLVLFSSDGVNNDIQGVWEGLNAFQFRKRFPNAINDEKMSMQVKEGLKGKYMFTEGFGVREENSSFTPLKVLRLNITKDTFYLFLQAYFEAHTDEEVQRFWKDKGESILFPKGGKDEQIIELVTNEYGDILSLRSQAYRTVIIGHLGFVEKGGIRGLGQGDVALGTAGMLQESEEILMDAYERTLSMMLRVPGAEAARENTFIERNKIFYSDEEISVIQAKFDLNAAVATKLYWKARLDMLFFLDTFQLLDKNRMPTAEINIRREDSFRMLGLFVAADTKFNLEPEVLTTMRIDIERTGAKPPPTTTERINVGYVSPIVKAMGDNTFLEYGKLMETVGRIEQFSPGVFKEEINPSRMASSLLRKTDNLDIATSTQEKEVMLRSKVAQSQLALQEQQNRALAEAGNRLNALGGNRGQQTQGSPQGNPGQQPPATG